MHRLALPLLCALALSAAAPGAAPPEAGGAEVAERVVNDPRPETFSAWGVNPPPRVRRDEGVQFGKALRVPIRGASPQPWASGLNVPVLKPVEAGDGLAIAFWARAERTEEGAPGRIARVQLEHSARPHRALFGQSFEVGPEWKMYSLTGETDQGYGARALQVTMHLAAAKQTLDIGPVFVLRYDR